MQPNAAIQAIQQATDPSAVVAAYASALELAMNNVSLHQAYVARMVDMGLPEMAYHQAQTLTTLQPNNGLAWGVLAYVDARRGQMTDAVAAINLAAPFAPNNQFVARTAGEIVAWYDQKADKSIISAQAKSGLARVRDLLGKQTAFTTAYDTAVRAYKAEASGQATPPAAPSSSDAAGAYAPQALPGPAGLPPRHGVGGTPMVTGTGRFSSPSA
jgi:Flp pilus assembly protein TadD